MKKSAFFRVFHNPERKTFQVVGYRKQETTDPRHITRLLFEGCNTAGRINVAFMVANDDSKEYREALLKWMQLPASPIEWPGASRYLRFEEAEAMIFIAPRPTQLKNNWKRFARQVTPATLDLYRFLVGPKTLTRQKTMTEKQSQLLAKHPAAAAIRYLNSKGGDLEAAHKFLTDVGDIRGSLINMKSAELTPDNFLASAGWVTDRWPNMREEISNAIRTAADSELASPKSPAENLVAAIIGKRFNPESDANSFASIIAKRYELKYAGLGFAVTVGAKLILSQWLATEYQQELCDDAAFDEYGLQAAFLPPFRVA